MWERAAVGSYSNSFLSTTFEFFLLNSVKMHLYIMAFILKLFEQNQQKYIWYWYYVYHSSETLKKKIVLK